MWREWIGAMSEGMGGEGGDRGTWGRGCARVKDGGSAADLGNSDGASMPETGAQTSSLPTPFADSVPRAQLG